MAAGSGRAAACDRCARSRRRVAELEAEFQRLREALVDVERAPADAAGVASGSGRGIGGGGGGSSSRSGPPERGGEGEEGEEGASGVVGTADASSSIDGDGLPRRVDDGLLERASAADAALENHNGEEIPDNAEFLALVEEGNRLTITVDTIIRSQIFELKDLC